VPPRAYVPPPPVATQSQATQNTQMHANVPQNVPQYPPVVPKIEPPHSVSLPQNQHNVQPNMQSQNTQVRAVPPRSNTAWQPQNNAPINTMTPARPNPHPSQFIATNVPPPNMAPRTSSPPMANPMPVTAAPAPSRQTLTDSDGEFFKCVN
jgi:hypothetical protein